MVLWFASLLMTCGEATFWEEPKAVCVPPFHSSQRLIASLLLAEKTFPSLLHCLSSLARDQSVVLYGSVSGVSVFPGHGFKSLRC